MPNMPSMRKNKSKSKSRGQRQRGGFFATVKGAHAVSTKPHAGQQGGSPASSIVMSDATMNPPVMNDYAGPDRIRDSWYDPSLAALEPKCGGQAGGSLASNLVMEQLTQKPKTEPFDPAWSPKVDMNSLNLYQTTGGARRRSRRSRKHKTARRHTKSKSKSRRNNRTRRNQRGGASDWIMSQYSLGNINAPEQPASWVSQFSQSSATARSELMNPSTLGLAGSGAAMGSLEGANVRHVGAPL